MKFPLADGAPVLRKTPVQPSGSCRWDPRAEARGLNSLALVVEQSVDLL